MARGLVPSRPFPTCLRRPCLFRLAGKDRGEKGRWLRLLRLVHAAGAIRASPDFRLLRTHVLTLRVLWYAPPVTVYQICKQLLLLLNDCGKNALRSKFAEQYEFAGVPKPPLAAPRAARGGGIFEENDGGDLFQISECSEICYVRIPSGSSPCAQGSLSGGQHFPALWSFRMSTIASTMTSALNAPTQARRMTSARCAACLAASCSASSAALCAASRAACSSA